MSIDFNLFYYTCQTLNNGVRMENRYRPDKIPWISNSSGTRDLRIITITSVVLSPGTANISSLTPSIQFTCVRRN